MRLIQEAEPTPTKGGVTNMGVVLVPFVTSQTDHLSSLLTGETLVKLMLTVKGTVVVWHPSLSVTGETPPVNNLTSSQQLDKFQTLLCFSSLHLFCGLRVCLTFSLPPE